MQISLNDNEYAFLIHSILLNESRFAHPVDENENERFHIEVNDENDENDSIDLQLNRFNESCHID
jgi:hypothetical protein